MKSTLKWVVIVSLGFLTGCATTPKTILENNTKFPAGTKFEVGEIKLKEGMKFDFLIEKVFSDALVSALQEEDLLVRPQDSTQKKIVIDTEELIYHVWGDTGSVMTSIKLKDEKNDVIGKTKTMMAKQGTVGRVIQASFGLIGNLIGNAITDAVTESNTNRSPEANAANEHFKEATKELVCEFKSLIDGAQLSDYCEAFCGKWTSQCSGYKEPYLVKTKGSDSDKDLANKDAK